MIPVIALTLLVLFATIWFQFAEDEMKDFVLAIGAFAMGIVAVDSGNPFIIFYSGCLVGFLIIAHSNSKETKDAQRVRDNHVSKTDV